MALLQKLSLAAVTSAAAFLTLGTFGVDSAQAALFKYSFEGEGVNGYVVYDDSTEGTQDSPTSTIYYDAVREYKIDLGDQGVFQGTTANAVVFLVRQGSGITAPETDDFLLEVRASQREPQSEYALLSYFSYPIGTFGGSRELPTTVPSTATINIYPNVNFPNSIGNRLFTGTIRTQIEKVPEPASVSALLGVGAWLIFRRRQRRQTLSV
ncbi:PEP-CTERM sorting domain-containing protein [Brasilonema sp. UFV-L1]|uniref:PEP-CTERM sorting domain-containing protein n=1 Tax=Brasilonema sp. UFV-L1 TaxID=2234130 RepID=UPI00145EDC0C|nr:PEP-CTERM sorting domain-containing protein [Brasilonema sp. UFV-L1]NMG09905.1 hypothetical protein [Brasilonema sp. UFV-L1]